jgi:hypothetical protein
MSPLTTKAQSLKFESKTAWSTARRPKNQEKFKKIIQKKEKSQGQQKHKKRQTKEKSKKNSKLKKTQNSP